MRFLLALLLFATPASADDPWTPLQPGLDLATFDSPKPSSRGDSKIRVLRVDPERFDLVLKMASEEATPTPKTSRQWADAHGLVAAINASMYATDLKSSVSFMKGPGHINNPRISKDMDLLMFDRTDAKVPRVQLVDRGCDDHEALLPKYRVAIQSIRMLSCDGRNVWSQQPKQWSHAVVGIDSAGWPMLIHARSPWSTHDFIDILRGLPIDLARLQYAEGGPEAQLFVRAGSTELEQFGSFETGFFESDTNAAAWPVPNVIGVVPRSP